MATNSAIDGENFVERIRGARCAARCAALATAMVIATPAVHAESFALAVRAGTLGYGIDADFSLAQRLSARVGYNGFNYSRDVNNTDVTYHGKLKISDVSGLLDWYVFDGGFRLTAGVVGSGLKVDVTGQPTNGTFTINHNNYSSSQLGSLSGELKFGNSVSPYVGLGWGNPVGSAHHLHFLFDIGAIYGGTPQVSLNAQCGPAAPQGSATCSQLQSDVQVERAKLASNVTLVKWYPVIDLGLAYRF